jgi:hypothetical protein
MLTEKRMKYFTTIKILQAFIGAWLGCLVVDFLWQAVFHMSWYRTNQSFRFPSDLFLRIPFGYFSFAVYYFVLTWLLFRLYNNDLSITKGMKFGAIAGAVYGGLFVGVTYSVFEIPQITLILWPLLNVIESTIAGGIAAWVLIAERPWSQVAKVFGISFMFFIIGTLVQNF